MSVSAGNADLSAIVNGGQDFINRLAEYKNVTAAHQKVLEDLNLGKAARAAHDEAHRLLGEAKEKRDTALAEVHKEMDIAKDSIKQYTDEGKARAASLISEANAKHVAAQAKLDAAVTECTEATANAAKAADALREAQAKADRIVAEAQAKAKQVTIAADALHKQAQAIKASADADKAKHAEILEKMQALAR